MLLEAAAKLKTKPIELGSRIQAQLEELRELRRTIEAYKDVYKRQAIMGRFSTASAKVCKSKVSLFIRWKLKDSVSASSSCFFICSR